MSNLIGPRASAYLADQLAMTGDSMRKGLVRQVQEVARPWRYAFRCSLGTRAPVAPETERQNIISVAAGWARRSGTATWTEIDAVDLDYSATGTVWIVYDEATPGWSAPFFLASTEDPPDDVIAVEIATVTVGDTTVLVQHHLGDIDAYVPPGEAGDMLYHDGSSWVRLMAPVSFTRDPFMRHNGTAPYWDEPAGCA